MQDSVLEWACGSGELGYRLLPRVGRYEGRDLSEGMLGRARKRWDRVSEKIKEKYAQAPFNKGEMVAGPGVGETWDWIFMNFALHLFDPGTARDVLARSLAAVNKGVILIDHEQRWRVLVALIERFEGSHYDQYLDVDFAELARSLGVGHRFHDVSGLLVLEPHK
jgi:Methyltransferase domain